MSATQPPIYEFGPFRVDPVRRRLLRADEEIHLKPKVFDTLLVLVESEGHLIGKEELMHAVWPDTAVEENNLTQNISVLRKTFGERPEDHRYIVTVPGQGYRFVADVAQSIGDDENVTMARLTKSHVVIEDELTITPERNQIARLPALVVNERSGKIGVPLSSALLIAALLATISGVLIYFSFTRGSHSEPAVTEVKKVAVLPFRSLSAAGDDEYLGLGVSDTLITRLSNMRQLVVRPTNAVRKYAGREFDPLAAGREQQVHAVLEGSVERAGDRLRVTVRLISIEDGRPVWGETFDEKFTDILTVQDQIAERLTDALAVRLTGEEKRNLAKQYTANTEAYQLYLKGRYFWNKRTAEDLKKSVMYFTQAVEKDPRFALAYAGLADSYSLLTDYEALPAGETYPEAKMAVTKALEIDGQLAEARTSLAYIKAFYEWDWAGAETEFKRAIELNPNYATAHQWYAEYLSAMGRTNEALVEIKRAEELDPVSLIISSVEAWILYFARDFDGAIAKCLNVIDMDPNFAEAYEYLKRAYDRKGMYREAISARQTRRRLLGRETRDNAALRVAASATSSKVYWQKRLELEIKESKEEELSAFEMAEILAQLGAKDRALEWLMKGHAQRHFMITYLKVAPNLDPLRSDPRFADLVARVGFPQ
jgi:DNA-binding winged helix-turn-helix (wHTH) protein/TolB-like protein/Tfp pilus assembly protein PilF